VVELQDSSKVNFCASRGRDLNCSIEPPIVSTMTSTRRFR
jgi:hypothetical protein